MRCWYGNELNDCDGCGKPTLAIVLGNIPLCECCQAKQDAEEEESAQHHP